MFFQKLRNRVESLIVLLDLIRSTYYLISLSRYSSHYSGCQVICINALLCMHTSSWNIRITLKNGQKEIPILGTLYLEEDPKFSGPEVQFCGRQKHFLLWKDCSKNRSVHGQFRVVRH